MWIVDQRPGDCDTLALTTGKFIWLVLGPVAETYRVEDFLRLYLALLAPDPCVDQR